MVMTCRRSCVPFPESASTTSLGVRQFQGRLHLNGCDRETAGSLPEALGHFPNGDAGPFGPEGSTAVGWRLPAGPPVGWRTQERGRHGGAAARWQRAEFATVPQPEPVGLETAVATHGGTPRACLPEPGGLDHR